MQCPSARCHKLLPADLHFCPYCGGAIRHNRAVKPLRPWLQIAGIALLLTIPVAIWSFQAYVAASEQTDPEATIQAFQRTTTAQALQLAATTHVAQSSYPALDRGTATPVPPPPATATPVPPPPATATPVPPPPPATATPPLDQPGQPGESTFAVGQQVRTNRLISQDLWSAAVGGVRVFNRPKLYGGSLVTILAIEPMAVFVRTADDVEGWIHSRAEDALTSDLTPGSEARFRPETQIQIVWANGVPLRTDPRPDAPKILEQIQAGRRGIVRDVRGDWLKIMLDDGPSGWARWYYDDKIYIDTVLTR